MKLDPAAKERLPGLHELQPQNQRKEKAEMAKTMSNLLARIRGIPELRQKMLEKGSGSLLGLAKKQVDEWAIPNEELTNLGLVIERAPGLINSFLHNGTEEDQATLVAAIANPPAAPKAESKPTPEREERRGYPDDDEVVAVMERLKVDVSAQRKLDQIIQEVAVEQARSHGIDNLATLGPIVLSTFRNLVAGRWNEPVVRKGKLRAYIGSALQKSQGAANARTVREVIELAFGRPARKLPKPTYTMVWEAVESGLTIEGIAEKLKLGFFGNTEPVINGENGDPGPGEATPEDIAAHNEEVAAREAVTLGEAATVVS